MKVFIFHLLALIVLVGCMPGKSNLQITMPKKGVNASSSVATASVSSVQVINNQLVINGNGFVDVTTVKVNGNSLNENFSIESKTATKIIANSIRGFSFDISKVFSLILSDANASATFAIDFSLCNATLNGKGFNCAAPVADKDVLAYDAVSGTWKPRPASGLNYLGTFDASTNPGAGPAIQPAGAYYVISDDGTVATVSFAVGDWLVSNGSTWQKIDNSSAVLSVFGRFGAITAQQGDYTLDLLGDVSFPVAPVAGKVLKFDGTNWVAGDDLSGGGAGSVTSTAIADGAIVNADINAAAAIDYSKLNIADGAIPAAKISGLPVLSSILAATITDGDTTHAPTGEAVYEALQTKIGTSGGTLSVGTISGVPTPVGPSDIVNKAYVDSAITGVSGLTTTDISEGASLYFTEARVLGTDLAGLNTGVNGPITAADTVLGAFGKMQYQVTDLKAKGQWDKTVNDISYSAGNVSIDKKLRLKSDNANYVEMLSPNSLAATYTLTLPANDGNANQVLKTDGAGVLAWVDVADSTVQAFAKSALPTCAAGEVLKSNGTTFSCVTDNAGAAAFSGTADRAVLTTAGGVLGVSATTSTELGYVSGVTSAIQTQLNGKQADLGFTPVNKAGDTISSGTFNFAGATLRASDPIAATDVVNKQYLESFGQWTKNGSDIYRSSGNVGIGTSTPGKQFTVNGTALIGSATTGFVDTWNALVIGNTALGPHFIMDGGSTSNRVRTLWNSSKYSISKCVTDSCGSTSSMFAFNSSSNVFEIPNSKISLAGSSPTHDLEFSTGATRRIGFDRTNTTESDLEINAGAPPVGSTDRHGGDLILKSGISTGTGDSGIQFFTVPPNATGTTDNSAFLRMQILPNGNVGIGASTPATQLDVNGAVRLGNDATACSAAISGAMRFNTPNVEFCNGTSWAAFGVSNAAVGSSQITDGTIVDADVAAAANIAATKLGTGAVDNTELNYLDGVTSSIQAQLAGKQATDPTLTALAAYNANGILVQTAGDTFVGRSIAGTVNRLTVTNGDGVAGNPTINIPTALLPSPIGGDVGKFLKATAADTSVWTALGSSDVTTALGFTPINKAGDSISTGTFTLSGTAVMRTPDPVGLTDIANRQWVENYITSTIGTKGQWTKGVGGNIADIYFDTGNVGIGKSSPAYALDVSTGADKYVRFSDADSVGEIMLGDGTATASQFIPLFYGKPIGPTKATMLLSQVATGEDTGATPAISLTGRVDTGTALATRPVLGIWNHSTQLMTVASSGKVGIGTTAPVYQMDVQNQNNDAVVRTFAFTTTANSGGTFIGSRARGTQAAPTHPLAGDLLAQYLGKNGVLGASNPGMVIWAGENHSNTAQGDFLTFITTPNTTTTSVERMRINGAGNVGIGTSSPQVKLDVSGPVKVGSGSVARSGDYLSLTTNSGTTKRSGIQFYQNGTGLYDIGIDPATDNTNTFYIHDSVNNANRFAIGPTGNVGIGNTVPDEKFVVFNGTTTGKYTTGGWTHSSDARLKHDIHTITNATENILKLRGVDYVLNNDPTNERQLGFIAQEVEQLFPEVVQTDKNGYKSMVYSNLIAPLVEAFKDLYKKVTDIFMTTEKNTRIIASVDLKVKKLEEENEKKSKELAMKSKEIAALKAYLCAKDPHAPICK